MTASTTQCGPPGLQTALILCLLLQVQLGSEKKIVFSTLLAYAFWAWLLVTGVRVTMAGLVRNLEAARVLLTMAERQVPKTKMRLLFVQVLLENGSGSERVRQHCGVAKSDGGLGSTSSEARGAHDGVCSFVFILFCTKSPALASCDEPLVNWSGKNVTTAFYHCCCFLLGV